MALNAPTRTDRYTRVAILFHWTIAAMILFNLWLGLFHDSLPREWKVMPVHKAMGLTILVLSLARLAWRLTNPPPPLPLGTPRWERVIATVTHRAFYVLMIALPLTGWAMASGGDPRRPLDWFGLFPIPYLPVDRATAGLGHDAHGVLGTLMTALVALHIAAALRHHFVRRDGLLGRMLPPAR